MTRLKKRLLIACGVILLCAATLAALLANGVLWFTEPFAARYAVRGVDVSEYQGDIDWDVLAGQDVDFAYIKATEGSGYIDPYFVANWRQAAEAGIVSGAYHFFSFDSAGETQGLLFIETVPTEAGRLVPVVDVEQYGSYKRAPKDADKVAAELAVLLGMLEEAYGAKPMIYTTGSAYRLYIEGRFEEYPLWIRNVYLPPRDSWAFWQYSDHGRLDGYSGAERFIDLNVFYAGEDELKQYILE